MKKIIVNENQRCLLFRNGRFVRVLPPGRHFLAGSGYATELYQLDSRLRESDSSLEALLRYPELAKQLTVADCPAGTILVHTTAGLFSEYLEPGKYAFWSDGGPHGFRACDAADPLVPDDVSSTLPVDMRNNCFSPLIVKEYETALLYCGGVFRRLLGTGTYYFWKTGPAVSTAVLDTRVQQMDVDGQEILTRDKATLRVNLALRYQITDFVRFRNDIQDCERQIRVLAQLALREAVSQSTLDELLENRERLSARIFDTLKKREGEFFISVRDAGVKDLILPGEMRDIMNTVLAAEKKAQANVIARREETASTRSLLNTARLMEENKTLMRLKEMEHIEKVCENVSSLSLTGSGGLTDQLTSLLSSRSA